MLKTLNTSKEVHWDKDSTHGSNMDVLLLTQFESQIKQKNLPYKGISSYIIQALKNNEYEKIFSYLDEVLPDKDLLQPLTDKQGHEFLKYALSYSRSNKVFGFIQRFFSKQDIQNALKKDNDYTLKQFFFSQHGAELAELDNSSYRELRVEKFKFIFELAGEIFEGFVVQNNNELYMTAKIKEDYALAKKAIQMKKQINIIKMQGL